MSILTYQKTRGHEDECLYQYNASPIPLFGGTGFPLLDYTHLAGEG